ncbi:MAG: family 10 glycosylhydrolase [Oscillospiraceae bacterium]|nr:family 10 glycosylhydrolase [Oscillospiraceae bacterium]
MITSVLLSVLITSAGCTAPPVPPEHTPAEGRLVLTDPVLPVVTPYVQELPAIGSPPVLSVSAQPSAPRTAYRTTNISGEIRAVWISFLELGPMMQGKTEAQFTQSVRTMFDRCADFGINTLYVQVRPYGDALYESSYFPWSFLCTGIEGQNPGYDPLAVMLREAKERGLRFEAWLNPYRVRSAGSSVALHSGNQAKKWLDQNDAAAISYQGIISYNPASAKARRLIINGALELIRKYRVDGIHIDDYFYPTTSEAFDRASYSSYRNSGGKMTLENWRRANVERLLRDMYSAIKEENPNVTFGISPQGNLSNNFNQQYFNSEKIISNPGYCDYIIPQIYYGFQNTTLPYAKTVDQWDRMTRAEGVELIIGLAAYKAGIADSWAGSGAQEWVRGRDILKRQVEYARNADNYKGFAVFRYASLFAPESGLRAHAQAEAANLRQILK